MDEARRAALIKALSAYLPAQRLQELAPMSRYTTLHLGGPADVLADLASAAELSQALGCAAQQDAPVTVIGNGSNLLVRDGGIRGLVVRVGEHMAGISAPTPLPDGRVALTAQAGASLAKLCAAAAEAGLTGLEFASGIPGTVGGAVCMNAGAYGGEMKDAVHAVTTRAPDGRSGAYSNADMRFGYRQSRLNQGGGLEIVTSATVALVPGDPAAIREAMRDFAARRRDKQPLTLPCCGSTFKRPPGHFAGTLIEGCGLKGLRVGGASVSQKHAGFLVNDQAGTAADYLALMAQVQRAVYEQTGVRLEPEVRILGEDAPKYPA